jgi:hypothetical protein
MNEPRDHLVYRFLDFTFFGKHGSPVDAILCDIWTGLAGVGLVEVGGRWLWNLAGLRGLLWVSLEIAGIWLLGLILRLWYSSSH